MCEAAAAGPAVSAGKSQAPTEVYAFPSGIDTIAADSHAALLSRLGLPISPDSSDRLPWVVDLSQGEWQPREAARQLAIQAGIRLPTPAASRPPLTQGEIIGWGIDAEARGPVAALIAATDSVALVDAILGSCERLDQSSNDPPTLIVWLPCPVDGRTALQVPGEDNQWLLHSLLPSLIAGGVHTCVAWRPAGLTPVAEPATWWPGLISESEFDELHSPPTDAWYRVRRAWLYCPSRRPPLSASHRTQIDRLRGSHWLNAWREAFIACHGHNYFVDASALSEAGWRCHAEGASDLALRWLVRARDCARDPLTRATIQARLQGVRIATQRFVEAAAEPPPPASLPAPLRDFLRQAIGWGRIMGGDVRHVDMDFGQPGEPRTGIAADARADLYRLNIHALGLARAGRGDEALRLEREIECRRSLSGDSDARLAYINHLNLARLLRQCGDHESAAKHYEKAFATNVGVRTPAEAVHIAWIRANLARARGDAAEAGLQFWRAALHWLAVAVPDAVPVRVAQAVLGQRLPAPTRRAAIMDQAMLDALKQSTALGELPTLTESAPQAEIDSVRSSSEEDWTLSATWPDSAHSSAMATVKGAKLTMFGAPGWCLGLWTAPPGDEHMGRHGKTRLAASPERRALLAEVRARLQPQLQSWRQSLGFATDCMHIVVDDQHGRELPRTASETARLCLLRGISRYVWDGNEVALDEPALRSAWAALRPRLGLAMAEVAVRPDGSADLIYRRHSERRWISQWHANWLDSVARHPAQQLSGFGDKATDPDGQAATALKQLWRWGAIDFSDGLIG